MAELMLQHFAPVERRVVPLPFARRDDRAEFSEADTQRAEIGQADSARRLVLKAVTELDRQRPLGFEAEFLRLPLI